eukprot:1830681-Rhodomonas_salina.1
MWENTPEITHIQPIGRSRGGPDETQQAPLVLWRRRRRGASARSGWRDAGLRGRESKEARRGPEGSGRRGVRVLGVDNLAVPLRIGRGIRIGITIISVIISSVISMMVDHRVRIKDCLLTVTPLDVRRLVSEVWVWLRRDRGLGPGCASGEERGRVGGGGERLDGAI